MSDGAASDRGGGDGRWRRRSRRVVLENPWYRVCQDRYGLPTGGDGEYTYVDIPGSTMVIPLCDDGRVVVVRQFRYLMQRSSIEFPAGGIPRGVEPLANARRELREETGYRAQSWQTLGAFAPYNGVSNEYCHVFIARDLEESDSAPEPTEEIEVLRRTPDELRALVRRGELWDGMTIACLGLLAWRA